jgi:hypothetical protein
LTSTRLNPTMPAGRRDPSHRSYTEETCYPSMNSAEAGRETNFTHAEPRKASGSITRSFDWPPNVTVWRLGQCWKQALPRTPTDDGIRIDSNYWQQ